MAQICTLLHAWLRSVCPVPRAQSPFDRLWILGLRVAAPLWMILDQMLGFWWTWPRTSRTLCLHRVSHPTRRLGTSSGFHRAIASGRSVGAHGRPKQELIVANETTTHQVSTDISEIISGILPGRDNRNRPHFVSWSSGFIRSLRRPMKKCYQELLRFLEADHRDKSCASSVRRSQARLHPRPLPQVPRGIPGPVFLSRP